MNRKSRTTPLRILSVGLPFDLPETDREDFYTDKHFLDYDIVILDPKGALKGPYHDYLNKIRGDELCLEERKAERFKERYRNITDKLTQFINKGGFAVVFLRRMPDLVDEFPVSPSTALIVSLDKYLPWGQNVLNKAHGNNIHFTSEYPFGQFWDVTNALWEYEAVYKDPPKVVRLAHVRGFIDEVVASYRETEQRGLLLLTPVLRLAGSISDVQLQSEEKELFVGAVISLFDALQAEHPVQQIPEWALSYFLPGEGELRAEILTTNEKIEALQNHVSDRTKALDELCLHKLLVTGHDSALERAVDRVLTDLGLEVEVGPKGRVDRTATYGEMKFAVEVQGTKRGAKEDHSRALTIWVQEVAISDGKEPKGLLVVNPYRDTPLAERTGTNFWPGETIKVCELLGHCAMTGLQLLGLYLDAKSDGAKRDILIGRMFSTKGLFEGYEDWTRFLHLVVSDPSENC